MAGSRRQRGRRLRLDSSLAGFLSKQQQQDLSHNIRCAGRKPPTSSRGRLWPQIRALLVAEKIAERCNRAVSPRVYMDGYVPGGRSENIVSSSQG
jgi:hypothetical protein